MVWVWRRDVFLYEIEREDMGEMIEVREEENVEFVLSDLNVGYFIGI